MTAAGVLKLAVESIGSPRDVARYLLSLRMPTEALWTAFALVIVINALAFGASFVFAPSTDGLPIFMASPAGYLATQAVTLGGSILAFTWTGRLLGGAGRIADMALLLIWLQALNVLVQIATLLLLPISPGLGGVVVIVTTGIGLWILLNFIAEAHGMHGLGRAFAVFLLGLLGLGFTLSVVLTLAGVTPDAMMNLPAS